MLTMIVAIIGLIIFAIPFVLSLNPTEKAKNSLLGLDIAELSGGDFWEVENDKFKILIIKDWSNTIYAYAVPYNKNGEYMMPDITWHRPINTCKKFGPEIENGKLRKSGTIKCFDDDLSDWWRGEYIWSYSGENLGKHHGALPKPKYVISNNKLLITGRGWVIE